ncbi:MAG: chorismate lyase [Betaproteobacteria bacterium]|nr:chorismate lyase [Betaproteobacteria bacterium]
MRTLRLTRIDAWRDKPPSYPHPLRRWLTDRGSLTARVIQTFPAFNLVRLRQQMLHPYPDERRHLDFRHGELAMVREVLLRSGPNTLVFAHSVVAGNDLRGAWRGLSRLGARPLAEMLFRDPTVVRLPMEYRRIDHRHPLYRRAAEVAPFSASALWARRSVFLKKSRPLLVTEVFLADDAGGEGVSRLAIWRAGP